MTNIISGTQSWFLFAHVVQSATCPEKEGFGDLCSGKLRTLLSEKFVHSKVCFETQKYKKYIMDIMDIKCLFSGIPHLEFAASSSICNFTKR